MTAAALSYLCYALMKWAGYSLYVRSARTKFDPVPISTAKLGAIRTGIGMVIGALFFVLVAFVAAKLGVKSGRNPFLIDPRLFFLLLVPIRVFEWWLILAYFLKARTAPVSRRARFIVLGLLVSFLLDLPAALGLIVFVSSIC